MSDPKHLLRPLRELEPTAEAVDALRTRIRSEAAPAAARRHALRPRAVRAGVLALAVALVALLTGGLALRGASDAPTVAGPSPLELAAAAAADRPGTAEAFSGYRHVVERERFDAPYYTPVDDACEKANGRLVERIRKDFIAEHGGDTRRAMRAYDKLAEEKGDDPLGIQRRLRKCPQGKAVTLYEQRTELWVDRNGRGIARSFPSRVVSVGPADEANANDRRAAQLAGDGFAGGPRTPVVRRSDPGDGPFGRVPLDELPTDPRQLIDLLRAANDDGRWLARKDLRPYKPGTDAENDWVLAHAIAGLLAEANLTPDLRAAMFRALALIDGVEEIGVVDDTTGRRGQAVEMRVGDMRLRVVFDPGTSDVLATETDHARVFEEKEVKRVLVFEKVEQVAEIPASVRRALK